MHVFEKPYVVYYDNHYGFLTNDPSIGPTTKLEAAKRFATASDAYDASKLRQTKCTIYHVALELTPVDTESLWQEQFMRDLRKLCEAYNQPVPEIDFSS